MSAPGTEDDGCPTTLRYSRTLYGSEAAFPRDHEYASPITNVGPRLRDRLIDAGCWVAGVATVGLLVWLWLTSPGVTP